MDAAYQKLIASGNENAVLETAKKVAADKPLFGYRLELAEFLKAMNAPPPAPAQVAGPMVDYPEYLAWKGFASGAKASYVSRIWEQNPPGGDRLAPMRVTERHTFTLQNTTPERELFWLTEIAYDQTGAATAPHDMEFRTPPSSPRRPQRTQGPGPKACRPGVTPEGSAPTSPTRRPGPPTQTAPGVTTEASAPAFTPPTTTADAAVSSRRLDRFTVPPTAPMETGEEVIEIKGKKLTTPGSPKRSRSSRSLPTPTARWW